MTKLRATTAHAIPDRPPVQVRPGQPVRAGQRDTVWPAFVFVTTGDGSGWIPERYLDTSGDPAIVLTSYDTTELATATGEELTLITQDDASGWAWVRNAADHLAAGALIYASGASDRTPRIPGLSRCLLSAGTRRGA